MGKNEYYGAYGGFARVYMGFVFNCVSKNFENSIKMFATGNLKNQISPSTLEYD